MDNPFPRSLGPLFYSSGRGITVRLLLSVGAAGRTISPIWSKNLLADLPYVCCRPHDQRRQLEPHMAAAVIPPWLGYQRRARRSQRRLPASVTQRPLLIFLQRWKVDNGSSEFTQVWQSSTLTREKVFLFPCNTEKKNTLFLLQEDTEGVFTVCSIQHNLINS